MDTNEILDILEDLLFVTMEYQALIEDMADDIENIVRAAHAGSAGGGGRVPRAGGGGRARRRLRLERRLHADRTILGERLRELRAARMRTSED